MGKKRITPEAVRMAEWYKALCSELHQELWVNLLLQFSQVMLWHFDPTCVKFAIGSTCVQMIWSFCGLVDSSVPRCGQAGEQSLLRCVWCGMSSLWPGGRAEPAEVHGVAVNALITR